MSIFVNINISSLNAQRQLSQSEQAFNQCFERLSSGFRINNAADDTAVQQISERITSQIKGLDQAIRNSNDAISITQTVELALAETTTSLQLTRLLALQSQNSINLSASKITGGMGFSSTKSEYSAGFNFATKSG